jgi:cell division protein FtsL
MTLKNDIEMTVSEAMEFRKDIIRKVTVRLTYSAITIFVAMVTTAFSFYYNTTYTLQSHTEKINKLEQNTVSKDVYESMNNKVERIDGKLDNIMYHLSKLK